MLCEKLRIYGMDNDFLEWIASYLIGRQQAVWISHVRSNFKESYLGVPQGSNLGPLLFTIFFNDLMYHVDCGVENYADDTSLIVSGSTVEEINNKLEANSNSVSRWMKSNKLKLNAKKSHVITVGTNDRLKNLSNTVQVVIDGSTVYEAPCKQELLLGC